MPEHSNHTTLIKIIEDIEHRLSAYYAFSCKASAAEHLISLQDASSLSTTQDSASQGGILMIPDQKADEVYIGLYLKEQVEEILTRLNPQKTLTHQNLNELCVLIEEISHFHLLLNRLEKGISTSHLELEWQGEIDKILVSGLILYEQLGDTYLLPLVRKIYDQSHIVVNNKELYWEATKLAARFWYEQIHFSQHKMNLGNLIHSASFRLFLRQLYEASWQQKLEIWSQHMAKQAS